MPTFAQNSRSRLSYGVQADFDTEAVSFQQLPYSTQSLDLTKERVAGTDVNTDRMQRVDRHGNRSVAGDIVVDLRADAYDDFLEAVMLGTWTADVLTTGITPKYFTIEDYAADIDQARLYIGMTPGSMSLEIAPNSMATTTFSMVGKNMLQSATEKTASAPVGTSPFDSYSGVIQLGDNGGTLTNNGRVSALSLSVTNNFAPTPVIGSDVTPTLSYGNSVVEGSLTVYYEDDSLMNRFLDEEESALSFSLDDPTGANAYTFLLPRIKINSATTAVTGNEGSRMVEASFVALYDATEGTDLSITRPDSA